MSEEKAIRVISFDGKIENWRVWKLKFLAKATHGGYKGAIDGTFVIPDESDALDPDDVEATRNRKANFLAYTALCLSCEGLAFGCVEKAQTTALPSGDAALAWKNLCAKYEPTTQMSLVSLKKEFAQCRLESVKQDPDEWVTKLEHYRMRIKGISTSGVITDEDLMVHIIANLPKAYSEFVTAIENDLEQETVTVTLDQLMSRLRNYYRRKFYSEASGRDSDEVALSAFKGLCLVDRMNQFVRHRSLSPIRTTHAVVSSMNSLYSMNILLCEKNLVLMSRLLHVDRSTQSTNALRC